MFARLLPPQPRVILGAADLTIGHFRQRRNLVLFCCDTAAVARPFLELLWEHRSTWADLNTQLLLLLPASAAPHAFSHLAPIVPDPSEELTRLVAPDGRPAVAVADRFGELRTVYSPAQLTPHLVEGLLADVAAIEIECPECGLWHGAPT